MKRRKLIQAVPMFTLMVASPLGYPFPVTLEAESHDIVLSKPEKEGGKSVLASLSERKTNRNISQKELPLQVLSNLLWAGFGVNRDSGNFGKKGRTAPSASNSQEIDLYIALPGGAYLYEAQGHHLLHVTA